MHAREVGSEATEAPAWYEGGRRTQRTRQLILSLPAAYRLLNLTGQPGEPRPVPTKTRPQGMKAAVVYQWKEKLAHPVPLRTKAQLELEVNPFRLRLLGYALHGCKLLDGVGIDEFAKLRQRLQESFVRQR